MKEKFFWEVTDIVDTNKLGFIERGINLFCLLKKFKVQNQKGATMVEASFILPVFFLFTFGIILVSVQLFSVYSTYYACFQSLKSSSTGPTKDAAGNVTKTVENKLKESLTEYLASLKTGVPITDVIVRNTQGCFKLSNFQAYTDSSVGCVGITQTAQIYPNTWITLEVPVKVLKLNLTNVPIPSMRVKSTVRMYDWS